MILFIATQEENWQWKGGIELFQQNLLANIYCKHTHREISHKAVNWSIQVHKLWTTRKLHRNSPSRSSSSSGLEDCPSAAFSHEACKDCCPSLFPSDFDAKTDSRPRRPTFSTPAWCTVHDQLNISFLLEHHISHIVSHCRLHITWRYIVWTFTKHIQSSSPVKAYLSVKSNLMQVDVSRAACQAIPACVCCAFCQVPKYQEIRHLGQPAKDQDGIGAKHGDVGVQWLDWDQVGCKLHIEAYLSAMLTCSIFVKCQIQKAEIYVVADAAGTKTCRPTSSA